MAKKKTRITKCIGNDHAWNVKDGSIRSYDRCECGSRLFKDQNIQLVPYSVPYYVPYYPTVNPLPYYPGIYPYTNTPSITWSGNSTGTQLPANTTSTFTIISDASSNFLLS